ACSAEELSRQWDRYIEHTQRNTTDLHRVFNSLWNLDKTKVDPLLLLKAALILQTCQRSPHVLAGCILYRGLIVSTQLPPPLTAKVLLQGDESPDQGEPGGEEQQEPGSPWPQGVRVLPVFLTEAEVSVLQDFPLEWRTRCSEGFLFPNPYVEEQDSPSERKCLVDSAVEQLSPQSQQELGRRKASEGDEPGALGQNRGSGGSSSAAGGTLWGLDGPGAAELQSRSHQAGAEAQEELPSDPAGDTHWPGSRERGCPPQLDGLGAQTGVEPGTQSSLVKMSLYVHCIKGLVLSLLAEDPLQEDQSSIEDV
ncbi:PREDICTED: Hermansky-Pudlak syndrome 4 protein, partial [Merops nubicus]|uniref:Hermansky-Pudlak syndrome 4 protein n=1 Tax=Merops nubicus TaxID=57421 RepID=UPI0004F0B124